MLCVAEKPGPPGLACLFAAESLPQAGSRCSRFGPDQTGAGEGALAFIRFSLPLLLVISHTARALSQGQEHMIRGGRIQSCQSKHRVLAPHSTTHCLCDLREGTSPIPFSLHLPVCFEDIPKSLAGHQPLLAYAERVLVDSRHCRLMTEHFSQRSLTWCTRHLLNIYFCLMCQPEGCPLGFKAGEELLSSARAGHSTTEADPGPPATESSRKAKSQMSRDVRFQKGGIY